MKHLEALSCIGIGTRTALGAHIPQPVVKRGGAPIARAMPVHAVLGLTMRYNYKVRSV